MNSGAKENVKESISASDVAKRLEEAKRKAVAAGDEPEKKPDVPVGDGNPTPEAPQGPTVQAMITVTLMTDGYVTINGPLDQPILFKGMIAEALDLQRTWQEEQRRKNQPKIKIPNLMERVLARAGVGRGK